MELAFTSPSFLKVMLSVKDCLTKAAEYEALSAGADAAPTLQRRYADLAQQYRLMAKERERQIAESLVLSEA